jgi:SpoU rRNA methylase family enzyme
MGNKVNEEAYGACNAIMRHKVTRAIKMSDTAFTYVCYAPIRALWKDAEAAFHDFQRVAHGMILKDGNTDAMADAYMAEYEKFKIFEQDIRNKLKYLKKKEVNNEIKKTKVPVTTMPKTAVLCQGELLCTPEASEATVRCQGIASESCLQAPGRAAPGESQPESAVQGQGGLCLPPGGDAGKEGSPRLPKAAVLCQGELLCTPEAAEAAVLCQGGRMVASESCLQAPGRAVPEEGQPEAAVQGKSGPQKHKMSTSERSDTEYHVDEMKLTDGVYDSSRDLMKTTLAKALKASETAFKDHGALRRVREEAVVAWEDYSDIAIGLMAKERGSDQKEAAASRETAYNKDADYYEPTQNKIRKRIRHIQRKDEKDDLRRTEAENKYKAKDDLHQSQNLVYNHKAKPSKAEEEGMDNNGNEEKHTIEACDKSKTFMRSNAAQNQPPDAAVQGQAGLRKASERFCMQPPGHDGGGQSEVAVQGQGALCLPPGGDAGKEGIPRLPKAAFQCQGELLCTPEAAEAGLCQGRLLCTELCCVNKIFKGQAGLCLHSGGDAGKEGSPQLPKAAFQCQGELLCTPGAAEAAVLCQAGLRRASERLCGPTPGYTGGGQPEAVVQGQGALCWPPGGDAGKEGSPHLPKAAVLCQGGLLCTPEAAEAALLCGGYKIFKGQTGLCLHSGGDAGKEGSPRLPKAAFQCQGELLCTPEAAEAGLCQGSLLCTELCCVHKIIKGQAGLCLHSGGDAGKKGSPRLPKAAFQCQGELLCTPEAAEAAVLCQGRLLCTPESAEAAVLCQGGRMVASESCLQAAERLCMPPPGHAGGGQPEAAVQGRGRLCLPPGGDAGKEGSPGLPKAACQCQGELLCRPEAAEAGLLLHSGGDAGKEGSPRLPKAAFQCQGELLCTPEAAEAAVLCQGGLMVASESCVQAPGRADQYRGECVALDCQSAADLDGADRGQVTARLVLKDCLGGVVRRYGGGAGCWSHLIG